MSEDADPGDARVRVRAVIRGRVQGVWFRGATAEQARRAGVDGWVCNRRDGAVEAVFEGPAESVAALAAFVRRGPPAARVESVDLCDEAPCGESGFRVRHGPD
jgi:acylphosphatase